VIFYGYCGLDLNRIFQKISKNAYQAFIRKIIFSRLLITIFTVYGKNILENSFVLPVVINLELELQQ